METLVIAVVLLWCLVIVLAFVVMALTRQIGILHERVAPAGALSPTAGPKVGETTAALVLPDLHGAEVTIGGASTDGRATLVLWVSPTCPVCRSLVPTARALAADERLRLVFASDGDTQAEHAAYVRDLGIGAFPYVVSQPLGLRYGVSKLPFAALIGADGVLGGKGLVNTREHLESLLEAMESGYATLQDYVRSQKDASSTPVRERAS